MSIGSCDMTSNQDRGVLVAIILMAACGASGCATLFSGTTQPITINTQPPGASLSMNGLYVGVTPVSTVVNRGKDLQLLLQRPGFANKTVVISKDFNTVAVLNLFSPLCWAIDIVSGAAWRFDNSTLLVVMDPAQAWPQSGAPAPGWGPPPPGYPVPAPGYPQSGYQQFPPGYPPPSSGYPPPPNGYPAPAPGDPTPAPSPAPPRVGAPPAPDPK